MQTSARYSTGFSSRAIMSNWTFGELDVVMSKIRKNDTASFIPDSSSIKLINKKNKMGS